MTNAKSTKRALLVSALSLVLCFAMLLGSTFAWFTDSASSANNIITSGNLDMELSFKPYGAENTAWTEIKEDTVVFGKDALYEPGYTEAVWLKVENVGSLAFRYNLAINVLSEKAGINRDGKSFKLSDYLEVKYLVAPSTDMESNYYTTRESLDSFAFGAAANSGVTSLEADVAMIKNGVAFSKNDAAMGDYSSSYVLVIISMPETVGNEACHDGKNIPEINFALNAYATQLSHEEDSFGSQYDKGASVASVEDMKKALADGATELNFMGNVINLNGMLTTAMIPEGTTVTIRNANVSGRSYGNDVDGTIIFENCTFSNSGAYSIHFDGGKGDVIFKSCTLYGWNSFGSTLNSVSFYDSALYGNGTYALIRSYVDMRLENCVIDTTNAIQNDEWPEGVETVEGGVLTMVNCTKVVASVSDLSAALKNAKEGEVIVVTEDMTFADGSSIHTNTSNVDIVIDGNGKTIESSASSVDAFQWEGGTIPAMSTIFSSSNGSKVVVNDMNFSGTMSAIMLGHYQSATYNNYNTELNNVNVVNTKVVSFSAGVSPAVCVYGTAVLNNCNVYGTTLSELDTDPMWPVYDVVATNYTDLTVNNSKIGSICMWNQAGVTVAEGSEVEVIIIRGNMNTTKYGLTIEAGATVGTIDLSNITNKAKINITIEDGATVGKIVANGVEYATIADWQNA